MPCSYFIRNERGARILLTKNLQKIHNLNLKFILYSQSPETCEQIINNIHILFTINPLFYELCPNYEPCSHFRNKQFYVQTMNTIHKNLLFLFTKCAVFFPFPYGIINTSREQRKELIKNES